MVHHDYCMVMHCNFYEYYVANLQEEIYSREINDFDPRVTFLSV